ncbi:hypothetical protein LT493_06345 [Streptomyces tricolor]|nr:hypothetical protein [Streptomyces tricolor]
MGAPGDVRRRSAAHAAGRDQPVDLQPGGGPRLPGPSGGPVPGGRVRLPLQDDPTRSAHVLSALATALDFDEVAYAGHVSAGAVNVALAEARRGRLGRPVPARRDRHGRRVCGADHRGDHPEPVLPGPDQHALPPGQCGGGAAAREGAPRGREWTAALGLALGILAVPLHHGVVTSDVKAFTAAAPVRLALDACDAAAHGLSGADEVLEHPEGCSPSSPRCPCPRPWTGCSGSAGTPTR